MTKTDLIPTASRRAVRLFGAIGAILSLFVVMISLLQPQLFSVLAEEVGTIPFNVAVLLALCAIALLLLTRGMLILAFTLGLILSPFGMVSFLQSVLLKDFGVDEFLMQNPFDDAVLSDARTPPALALCLFLFGLALLTLSQRSKSRLRLLMPALSAIGIVFLTLVSSSIFTSSIGEAVDPNASISLLLSLILLPVALAILAQTIQEFHDTGVRGEAFFPLAVGGLAILFSVVIWNFSSKLQTETIRAKLRERTSVQALAINNALAVHTKALKKMLVGMPTSLQEGVAKKNWTEQVRLIARELSDLTSVELVGLDNTTLWALPLHHHTNVATDDITMGLEMRRRAIEAAAQGKRIIFSKGFKLDQGKIGRRGFLMVLPVIDENATKNFLVATVEAESFFTQLTPEGNYSVIVTEMGVPLFATDFDDTNKSGIWASSLRVPTVKVKWTLRLNPSAGTLLEMSSGVPAIMLLLGLVISFLLAVIVNFRSLIKENAGQANLGNERFQLIGNLVPVGVFQANINGEFLSVNHAWASFTGLSPEELLRHGWKQNIHPEDLEKVHEQWNRGAQENLPFAIHYRTVLREGSEYVVRGKVAPVHDRSNAVHSYVGTLEVVT